MMADGNACLDACTEAVVKGETLSGLSHLAGCGAFLVGGDGACMDISVDGAGNAACPGRGGWGNSIRRPGRSGGSKDDAPGNA